MDLLNKLTIKNLKLNKKRTIVTIIGIMLSVALITAVATMYSSPINSIRNSADIKMKSKKIKSPKIVNKLFGIGGEISYKNFKRNKKK